MDHGANVLVEGATHRNARVDRVLPVEYRRRAFRAGCRDWGDELPVLRRDVALKPDGTRRWCS